MCQRRTSTGSANARESALNASKNVALPTMTRARMWKRENGMLSRRPSNDGASAFAKGGSPCDPPSQRWLGEPLSRFVPADESPDCGSAIREEATQLRCDAIGTLDGREMTRARNDRQGRVRDRFEQHT